MKKKSYIILGILLFSFCAYYYWNNRYVELLPVIKNENDNFRKIIVSNNDLFIVLERNQAPPNFYKNIKYVLERERQSYILKNGVIFIKYKYMRDLEIIWNYTLKTNDSDWFKSQREMDSLNNYRNELQDETELKRD